MPFAILLSLFHAKAQEVSLDYFLKTAQQTNDSLYSTSILQKITLLQEQMIVAQNKAPQLEAVANVVVAPYFNTNGKVIDITTNPSPNAFGYDVGVTNGGLYAAQLKVTQQLFNQAIVNNLIFRQKVKMDSLALSYDEIYHNLKNNLARLYVTAYGYQMQEKLNEGLIADLETRLKVIEVLVKNGILLQSDYLLVQVNIDQTKINLEQIRNNQRETLRQLYALSALPLDENAKLQFPALVITPTKDEFFYQKRFHNDSLQVEADRQVFNNRYKPKISAYVDGGLNAIQIPNIYHKIGASVGLQFNLPIYDGHQKWINEQKSRFRQENLLHSLQKEKKVKEVNLRSLLDQIGAQDDNLALMRQQLKRQEALRDIYKEKLFKGQVSVIDYLNVIQNYRTAESVGIQMQTNLWLLRNQYNYINW